MIAVYIPLPSTTTTNKEAVRKDGADIPRITSSWGGVSNASSFKLIHRRRHRHLTWSATHDVVSREINPWKFRPLDGIEPVTVGTNCNVLNHQTAGTH